MKKLLSVVVLVLFVAASAFAGATSFTKESSQAGYPGVLVPGSMTGTNVFITDIALMTNTAMFEYIYGSTIGLIAIKTDMGVMGLSISPSYSPTITGIAVTRPLNMLGLQYVAPMGGMEIGVGINYGVTNTAWENKEVVNNALTGDVKSNFTQLLAVKLGTVLKGGMDLGLTVGLSNDIASVKDLDNVSKAEESKTIQDNSKIFTNLAARMGLGKDMTVVGAVDFATGQLKLTSTQDTDNNGVKEVDSENTYSNMEIGVSALVGKDIKATETLKVKIASGLSFTTDGQALYLVNNKVAGTKVYNGTSYSAIAIRMPINFAVEGKLNDTWSINAGTSSNLMYADARGDKVNPDTAASKFNDEEVSGGFGIDPNLTFAIGVTGKIGDLSLDLFIEPSIMIQGPYFLTGVNSGFLNSGIAFSYNWK